MVGKKSMMNHALWFLRRGRKWHTDCPHYGAQRKTYEFGRVRGKYNPPTGRGTTGNKTGIFGKQKSHPPYSLFDGCLIHEDFSRLDHLIVFSIEAHTGLGWGSPASPQSTVTAVNYSGAFGYCWTFCSVLTSFLRRGPETCLFLKWWWRKAQFGLWDSFGGKQSRFRKQSFYSSFTWSDVALSRKVFRNVFPVHVNDTYRI